MGRKGWAGAPPADDDEARKRIVDATLRIMDSPGAAQTTVSDVADALGIARRTVYNYFSSTEELFAAVAELSLQGFVADAKSIIADLDVTAQLVEVVAYAIERLPREPQLALLLANDRSHTFSRTMLASSEIARCREFLQQAHIDWAALGYDDQTVDELAEFLLRIIQSMVVAPPESPRSGAELRAYLRRWIAPAFA
ncbi:MULTISPECIES: TetR/AcrR family transcriptional regulator [unclassified Mycobacterium]|uniref:TetR/AcrR family transcriptional regulator n=1 Tax=unclassified Mycobacterium TaxID=2642494 RepID=UPI0029C75B48|nr:MULTISPECIES: TetR/AcrR family transcriptional regulator [unclassified Mycobacterium]